MANMTFKADLLPNSDYGYSLGSATSSQMKRWIVPGTTVETIIGTQTGNTGSWIGTSKTIKNLYDGLTIRYFLPYSPSGNATLNLTLADGTTTGAINCYYNENRLTTHFGRGSVITLTYFSAGSISVNGTATTDARWIANANYDSNDTGYYHRKIYPNLKAGSNKIHPYTLIMENKDGRWESLISTNPGTGSNHVANTHGFLLGNVYCMYASATYNENAAVGTYNIWSAHTGLIDVRYSFNLTNSAGFTGYKPVYIVGTIGSDGLFYLDTTKWWAQDLPTTDDGKVYVYIGDAYDWYRLTFEEVNPAYFYRDSRVQMYAPGRGIKGISRSGTTFTVTRDDGSTFTFTQQDNNSLNWGQITQSGANNIEEGTSDFTDNTEIFSSYASNNGFADTNATGKVYRRDAVKMYNYIKTKLAVTNNNINLSRNTETTIATIGGTAIKIKLPASDNTWRGIQDNLTSSTNTTESLSAKQGYLLANGSARDNTKLPLAGGTMTGGLEIKGHIAGDGGTAGHGLYSGGAYHNAYNNIILHGDATTGSSGIAFVSDKGDTTINQPSDRAFIQYHASGVTTYTAEGSAPTLATSGEAGRLVIGIGNDAGDKILLQAPGHTDIMHQMGASQGVIPDTNNTTGTVGSGTQPVWVDAGIIKNTTYTLGKSVPSNAVFTDTNNAVTQTNQTGANDYRILLSGSANDTTTTEGANKSTNLRFNPSTKVFSVGGDISATGDLTLTGNANLNSETYAESITAGSLLVNGAANFVNIPTAPTPVATSNDTSIATTAFVMNAFTANDAMVFKGVINANSALPTDHKQGWTYRVGTAGTYANKVCEVGDIIICVTEGTAANNDHWAVIQNNVDGAVYKGTNAFTDTHVIIADSTAGKVKDSGKTITTTAPSSSAADTTIPTSKAVWSAISGASGYGKTGTVTSITAGAGLNTTSNDTATDGGSITSSGTLYLTKTGVAAGSYGPSAAVTGNEGTTMNVPYITVDKYGRVTSISNKTYTAKNTTYTFTAGTSTLAWNSEVTLATVGGLAIKAKLPANPNTNTDTLVKQTVKTDNVNYKLLGTTSASPSSGTAMEATYSANVYANPSTGAVSAIRHTLNVGGTDKAYMAFNSTTNAIDFIFV